MSEHKDETRIETVKVLETGKWHVLVEYGGTGAYGPPLDTWAEADEAARALAAEVAEEAGIPPPVTDASRDGQLVVLMPTDEEDEAS